MKDNGYFNKSFARIVKRPGPKIAHLGAPGLMLMQNVNQSSKKNDDEDQDFGLSSNRKMSDQLMIGGKEYLENRLKTSKPDSLHIESQIKFVKKKEDTFSGNIGSKKSTKNSREFQQDTSNLIEETKTLLTVRESFKTQITLSPTVHEQKAFRRIKRPFKNYHDLDKDQDVKLKQLSDIYTNLISDKSMTNLIDIINPVVSMERMKEIEDVSEHDSLKLDKSTQNNNELIIRVNSLSEDGEFANTQTVNDMLDNKHHSIGSRSVITKIINYNHVKYCIDKKIK